MEGRSIKKTSLSLLLLQSGRFGHKSAEPPVHWNSSTNEAFLSLAGESFLSWFSLGPPGRFDHLFVGSAPWILPLLLGVTLTWSGIILHLAHRP